MEIHDRDHIYVYVTKARDFCHVEVDNYPEGEPPRDRSRDQRQKEVDWIMTTPFQPIRSRDFSRRYDNTVS